MENLKTLVVDGKKCYEKSLKRPVVVSEYGVQTIKGSDIAREANIPVGIKINQDDDYVMLKGYLNNKLIPGSNEQNFDSYGDAATGESVYDYSRLKSNPIALVNHDNNAAGIAGNYIYLDENEQGLKFKLILRSLNEVYDATTKDAISAWGRGYGKAFSIGGKWYFDLEESDPENNKWILVKAILHEASLVAIGADSYALSAVPNTGKSEQEGKEQPLTLDGAVRKWIETKDDKYLVMIENIKKGETKWIN